MDVTSIGPRYAETLIGPDSIRPRTRTSRGIPGARVGTDESPPVGGAVGTCDVPRGQRPEFGSELGHRAGWDTGLPVRAGTEFAGGAMGCLPPRPVAVDEARTVRKAARLRFRRGQSVQSQELRMTSGYRDETPDGHPATTSDADDRLLSAAPALHVARRGTPGPRGRAGARDIRRV